MYRRVKKIVFVPSFGDLFLIGAAGSFFDVEEFASFRPLFWGFVFNEKVSATPKKRR